MRPRLVSTLASIALVTLTLVIAPVALARTAAPAGGGVRVEYRLPFLAGQSYPVTQSWHSTYTHNGHSAYAYDFGLPEGTPVVAAAAGVVAYAESGHRGCGDESLRNAANFVTIYHADGTATLYAHLSRVSVRVGQVVTGGEVIGLSGKSGFTGCEPHLHFARQRQGHAVTQSIPVYFVETGHRQVRQGVEVTSHNPICSQSSAGMPNDAFCAVYTTPAAPAPAQLVRLEQAVDVPPAPTGAGNHARASAALERSASWIGRFTFTDSGIYTFTLTSGSEVQLWIDGVVAIDAATDPIVAGDHVLRVWMSSGQHVIQLTDPSIAGAYVRLDWRETGPGTAVELN